MGFKIYTYLLLTITITNAQPLGVNDFPGNIYNYGDNMASASQFYSSLYTPPSDSEKSPTLTPGLSQFQQIPSNAQEPAYSHYTPLYTSPHTSYNPYRVSHLPAKAFVTPSETIITPVQHSTVIHHTPYLSSVTSQSPPFVGKLVYVNGKPSPPAHVHVQPVISPNPPIQHPLQKPLHYQQHPQHPLQSKRAQRLRPSPPQQLQQGHQGEFVPIRNPAGRSQAKYLPRPQQEAPLPEHSESSKEEENEEEDKEDAREDEREDVRERENDDEEEENEKGEVNEDNEEDDEDSNERGRYRNEEVEEGDDEEEEERPKYTNYSFDLPSNAPQKSKKNKNKHQPHHHEDDEEEDDDRRGGYKTHEDVEEDEDEDSNEDSSKVSFNKYVLEKVPKGFKIDKFDKQPPLSKSPYKSTKTEKPKFDYERVSFTTLRPLAQDKKPTNAGSKSPKNKPRGDRGDRDDTQGRYSKVVPTTTKHMYREKWFIMKKV